MNENSQKLKTATFDNSFTRELPADPNTENQRRQVTGACFSRVLPTKVAKPQLVEYSREVAELLDLSPEYCESEEFAQVFGGNLLLDGMDAYAACYGGHQFGGWAGQLGDGRAINLGEIVNRRRERWTLQLKGAGPTPYSRTADGLAVLRSSVREFLCSEAVYHVGVPTTRALAAVASGDQVVREGFEPGGIFTRVANSHVRIGTFQWFAAREDYDNLKILADYVIDRHYPAVQQEENPYQSLLKGLIEWQASLIAHWMQLGFIHGVMNTDNMTVSGETIDYGPCAFLDNYEAAKRFSSIDRQGRYAFGNQGPIGHWNLTRFAETLLPLLDNDREKAIAAAEAALGRFPDLYQNALQERFVAKIGIESGDTSDWRMVETLLTAMEEGEADFTQVFRHLPTALPAGNDQVLTRLFNQPAAIVTWLNAWRARLQQCDLDQAVTLMRQTNPVYIPRNHRVEQAIEAGNRGDMTLFHQLNQVLQDPFNEQTEFSEYEAAPTPTEVVQATFCGT